MVVKRIAVMVVSLMLVLGMSATVFASEAPSNANPSNGGTIVIEKNLKVKNPTLSSVDGPGAGFSYEVAPVAPADANGGTTITDGTHTATVHQGPAGGVTLSASTIEYPIGTAVNASAAGADNIKSITATADISKFSAPGIYRYELTETDDLGSCGVTDTGSNKRWIDVYVENGESGLTIAGMVMHDGTVDASHKKTFDAAEFETVNIVLEKEVQGNMGDKNNEFPFQISLSDYGRYCYGHENAEPTAVDGDKITTPAPVRAAASPITVNLKHGDKYYINGLSHEAAVAYIETNNTSDVYQVAIEGGTASAASAVNPNNTKEMASTDVDSALSVKYINTFESVSPTGVIMRFGPYIGMVLAAIAFAFVFRRTRKANNA